MDKHIALSDSSLRTPDSESTTAGSSQIQDLRKMFICWWHRSTVLRFMIPFMIPLTIFWILPLIGSFLISFTDWNYISPRMNFVGLNNYFHVFTSHGFQRAVRNTILFSLGTNMTTIALGLVMAMGFQNHYRGSRFYQMAIFSPWVTPAVAVSMVWSWIYQPERGLANYLLTSLGFAPLQWLHSSDTAMLGIVIFTIWKTVGWTMLFYIGALERVPQSLYEAAHLDGCSAWNRFRYITLPLISPTTFFLFIVNMITSIQVYDQIQIMTQGGPGGSTTTLLYLYYQQAFQNFQMGPANAVAMVILVLILVLSILSMKISKRWVHYD
ncbi:carbohydrate ABC transporter permease [Anoxynatronum buryatiense]|uniref:Carbohydrate ABC transporter membrane protein 1, CUT1 family n=1 Tax=Anoxynatronum buryatiense TaxID=489973 RepID=A0AA46AHL4_9CLOT|nr:carbohydrate ABC transporter membrane protein 1, CUT1 family [Anoxynatronum buryatiense]